MDNHIKKQEIHESANISDRAKIEGKVWISKGVKVFEGSCIRGPCFIGENCVIGGHSLVRQYSSLGQRCVVGYSTEVKHSLIGDDCWFHKNYIGDSIISKNCLFGAGTVTANYRFDERNIKVKIGGTRIDSGTNKLGVIMGENCKTGINSCIEPGIKVGPESLVGPNVDLQEDLEPNKIILVNKTSYIKKDNFVKIFEDNKKQLMNELLKK
jgi:bifunctional UDP-N-acetylglucosamine pyrophosphorylase/glucosamine-1-phosphate N-acetyltransferase